MPVAVCDNRIWITFGIFTAIRGGLNQKKKTKRERENGLRGRQHSSQQGQANKQTKQNTTNQTKLNQKSWQLENRIRLWNYFHQVFRHN